MLGARLSRDVCACLAFCAVPLRLLLSLRACKCHTAYIAPSHSVFPYNAMNTLSHSLYP